LTEEGFDAFRVGDRPRLAVYLCLTEYQEDFDLPVLFRREHPQRVLGDVFAEAGWEQMRLAETEKYAHVTYFLNGGREDRLPGEERVLVPSPKVATYDEAPAMSAEAITREAVRWIGLGGRRLLVVNFANADMVGHTGDLGAAIEACRVVDRCLGRLLEAVDAAGGLLLVTADHGNAETMIDERGKPMTAHTTGPVPIVVHDALGDGCRLRAGGGLRDVAPTLLALAGLPRPEEMTGRSLVERDG
jgi:2,3-bisphosphoglycerate-independent phosphoglycerate mutase